MLWITKYRHNKIVEEYKEALQVSRENLNRKEKFEEICEKLTDKILGNCLSISDMGNWVGPKGLILSDDVLVYVDDYFGGKVIKQEATPVTILDKGGKATYALTKRSPNKGKDYLLIQKN